MLTKSATGPSKTTMSEGESHWIAAARRGDHTAFRRLVDAHARAVYPVCLRILGDPALAEDAVQDALLNAFRGLARFDGRSEFRTWLHRIAVNAAIATARSRPAFVSDHADDEDDTATTRMPDPHADPFAIAQGLETGTRVGRALQDLTPLERTAFVLRHIEQHSLEDIATALASNINAIKQAVFRAVRKLRIALATDEVPA
jgi:RNA polymerase sigma-70 factor, ECF subfamily